MTRPHRPVRRVLSRWYSLPFEVLIGQLVVITGLFGLLRIGGISQDALSLLLPSALVDGLSVLYGIAGLLILYGIGRGRPGPEAAGLVLVTASTVIRTYALLILAGLDDRIATALFFNLFVVIACGSRIASLFHHDVIVRVKPIDPPTGVDG